jgi:hypothetical protein
LQVRARRTPRRTTCRCSDRPDVAMVSQSTFIGVKDRTPPTNRGDFYWTYHKYQAKPITYEMFQQSMENLRKFHVILITEWLNTSVPILERTLHWKSPPKQVLPHEVQAVRADKRLKSAKDILPPHDYEAIIAENALDVLFFHITKRIYMERVLCQ